jgi:glycosyltransferase involved in cell wall biosynthesis
MNGVALAYAGVHQIFQLALAAYEMGELDGLFCSLVDGEGKWGRRLGKWVPPGTARPLGSAAIPAQRLTEFPWPLLANRMLKKLLPSRRSDHWHSNAWFDHAAARWLGRSKAKVFVGSESCALTSLRQAGELGMKRVLDCPGIPSQLLDAEARLAAEKFELNISTSASSAAMMERKQLELAEADLVLCCSDYQCQRLLSLHPAVKRAEVIPLWTDVDFWSGCVSARGRSPVGGPLRVLYAGAVSLRKGAPYLLQAVEPLASEIELTLVGGVAPEMAGILKRFRSHHHLPYLPKHELRDLYREHDVLVMPTLGDSFGFVTIEAMASGMPVIASHNAGAPVPDEAWRVPPHDVEAIRQRLLSYHADRDKLHHDGKVAASFAAQFTPERYRLRVWELFKELLQS